jgi:hypothetical protein
MDIASIASFLLPTLLSMLSGEGYRNIQEKIFPSSKNYSKMAMYGYGYRYPKAPRIAFYDDPDYRFRWVRAAIGNRAIAAKSPWLAFLKREGAFEAIAKLNKEIASLEALLKWQPPAQQLDHNLLLNLVLLNKN